MTAVPAAPPRLDRDQHAAVVRVIDAFVWRRDGPSVAGLAVLGLPFIADALAAVDTLQRVAGLHRPRTWKNGTTVVCDACNTAFPCPTMAVLGAT